MPDDLKLKALEQSHPLVYEAFIQQDVRISIRSDMSPMLMRCIWWHATDPHSNFDMRQKTSRLRFNEIWACMSTAGGKFASMIPALEQSWYKAVMSMKRNPLDFHDREAHIKLFYETEVACSTYQDALAVTAIRHRKFQVVCDYLRIKSAAPFAGQEEKTQLAWSKVVDIIKDNGDEEGDLEMMDDTKEGPGGATEARYLDAMFGFIETAFSGLKVEDTKSYDKEYTKVDEIFEEDDGDGLFVPA